MFQTGPATESLRRLRALSGRGVDDWHPRSPRRAAADHAREADRQLVGGADTNPRWRRTCVPPALCHGLGPQAVAEGAERRAAGVPRQRGPDRRRVFARHPVELSAVAAEAQVAKARRAAVARGGRPRAAARGRRVAGFVAATPPHALGAGAAARRRTRRARHRDVGRSAASHRCRRRGSGSAPKVPACARGPCRVKPGAGTGSPERSTAL